MKNGHDNPYAAPVEEVQHPPLFYPLGKLTIPWMIAFNIGLGWSVGSLFTYALSFYFSDRNVPALLESLMSTPLVNDTDDLAGLLCYSCCFLFFAREAAPGIFKARHTWQLPFPPFLPTVKAFVRSSVLMAPAWIVAGVFFGVYRNRLPGDGNWPAIACLSGIASFQWHLFHQFMARTQASAPP